MIFILNGASFSSTIGTIPNISRYIGSVGTGGTGGSTEPIDVKLTFNYSPASATLTLTYNDGTSKTKTDTGDGTYQLTIKSGTSISWTLKADGYNDKRGTIVMPAWNKTETQSLVSTGGSGGGEPEIPVNPPSGENVPLTFYDHSNGNDWYVMYSKNDEAAGTTIRYGLNTSNSEKAKNYVCALENGATYRITFKNNTAKAYRCRMVTFAEPFASITKSALSADASTGTTTTNVIYYDRDNTVSEYTTTFTNTLNHKTLAMTLGWAATAKGNVDIDVTVTKIGEGEGSDTPETDDGELITGLYAAKDFFLKTGTDLSGAAITVPVASDTNNARNFVCELENGATYTYSYTNSGATSTYRTVIATFAPTMGNIKIAPLGSTVSGINASTVSGAVKVVHEAAKQTEGTYTGTFTNTENAKTLIMFVGWGVDASNVTASVKKIS